MAIPGSSGTYADHALKAGLISSLCCVSGTPDCQQDPGFTGHLRPSGATSLDAIGVKAKKVAGLKISQF